MSDPETTRLIHQSLLGDAWENARQAVLVFDDANNFVAFNATTGEVLWHAGLHSSITNGPITFEMDDQQYVVVGAGDSLYAFVQSR